MYGIPDCSECIHNDKDPCDNPCFHCLDGYNGRPDFRRKPEKVEEKKKEKLIFVSEDEPLPWVQP